MRDMVEVYPFSYTSGFKVDRSRTTTVEKTTLSRPHEV